MSMRLWITCSGFLLTALLVLAPASTGYAFQDAPAETDAVQQDTTAPAVGMRKPGEFPPVPSDVPITTAARRGGQSFLSLFKFSLIIGMVVLWMWTSAWMNDDNRSLKLRPVFWSNILLCAGVIGFLLALISPNFSLAILVALAAYGAPVGVYINERNQHVPENAKLLTPNHIRNVGIRTLARMGIDIAPKEIREKAIGPSIHFIGQGKDGRNKSKAVESSKGYLAAKELVYDAVMRRCTDIHLEPREGETSVRLRIDGVMYPTEPFDKAIGENVVNIFKVLSAMDITEKRKPQDGSFRAEMDLREIDFRIATQGTRYGEKMVMRILDQSGSVSRLGELGMRPALQENLIKLISEPHGMILTCGPTGSGKSTTLYTFLNEIDTYERNVITIEDPIEYKMDTVTQIEINNKAGQTFAGSLRSVLRQDPDVVMIGEIRDGETATIACQASSTGHMVFSTVHANDTFTALFRMMDLGVEPFMLSSSVSAILGQRLARRLCPDCKVAYKPKPEFLKKANLPVEKIDKFYKPATDTEIPCPTCGGLGYKGRIGVYELLVINERMRDMIRERESVSNIKAEARKNNMLLMQEEGLRLVVKGITSVEEMLRVVK